VGWTRPHKHRTAQPRLRRRGAAIALVLAMFATAACGGGADTATTDAEGNVTINVGLMPITSTAALQLGVQKGFFKEERLEVNTHVVQSGAAAVPAVTSGQFQFAFSNNVSLLIAHAKGLPVRVVRTANSAGSDPAPSQESLVVGKDSGISDPKQLEGKTIAVNSLNNTPHLAVLIALDKAGVDTSTVKFVETGYPDMPLALEEGRVDAVDLAEPFLRVSLDKGARALADPYRVVKQDLHLSSWFGNQQYIAQNRDVVDRFARAVDKSNAYAREHSDEIRQFVPTYLNVDAALAGKMALPNYPEGTESVAGLEMLASNAQRFGFVEKLPDKVDELLVDNQG